MATWINIIETVGLISAHEREVNSTLNREEARGWTVEKIDFSIRTAPTYNFGGSKIGHDIIRTTVVVFYQDTKNQTNESIS